MPLYHFSEDRRIARFEPHVPEQRAAIEPFVWAIDEWHAPMYYVPRDCPRACFWPGPQTTAADRERWFAGVEARIVIAVEAAWLDRIRACELYCYTLPVASFALNDEPAGHWVSCEAVEPISVEPVGDLLRALAAANVELRVTPTLAELWSRVIETSLCFSGTRLRNTAWWAEMAAS